MPRTTKKAAAELRIESKILLPPRTYFGRVPKYQAALGTMKVGDSFVVKNVASTSSPLGGPLAVAKKKYGFKFSQRRLPDGSLRVWRVE